MMIRVSHDPGCCRATPARRPGCHCHTRSCGSPPTSTQTSRRSAPSSTGSSSTSTAVILLMPTTSLATSSSVSSTQLISSCHKGCVLSVKYFSKCKYFQTLESAACLPRSVVLSSLCHLKLCLH